MTLARNVTVGSVLMLLVACGGGVTSIDPGSSSSSSSSSSSGSSGASSSGSSGASSSGSSGSTCAIEDLAVARACVPPFAKPNVPLTLAIEGQGCEGCGATLQGCTVEMAGRTIKLSLTMQTCPLPPDTGCATICKIPQTTCALPALSAGTYLVELVADRTKQGVIPTTPRSLVVEEGATDASCALTQGPPQPVKTDGYAKSCNAPSDCIAVVSGDPCARNCPNAAIATSAEEAYSAEYRARASQCPPQEFAPGGACPQPIVSCSGGQCVLGP